MDDEEGGCGNETDDDDDDDNDSDDVDRLDRQTDRLTDWIGFNGCVNI